VDDTSTWLISVDAASAVLAEVPTLLSDHRLAHQRLDADKVMNRFAGKRADISLLLGGPLQTAMLDALRHLVPLHPPTLVTRQGPHQSPRRDPSQQCTASRVEGSRAPPDCRPGDLS